MDGNFIIGFYVFFFNMLFFCIFMMNFDVLELWFVEFVIVV